MSKSPFFKMSLNSTSFLYSSTLILRFYPKTRQSSKEDLDVYLYIQVWLRWYKLPNEDQAMSLETNLVINHKKKALQRHKDSNSIHVRGKKKRRQIFIFIPKKKVLLKCSTRNGKLRHICMNLFKWQSSNLEWWWLGTALGCGFGDGKRQDYVGSME